jgi:hypothetical protein
MLRLFKILGSICLLVAGLTTGRAFSLIGPINEAYQVPEIGYNLPGDIGAPKNLGEQYRWNIPVMVYAFDQSFLDYFGSNGVRAVDQAFGVFNALQPVSSYSSDLGEVPTTTLRQNYRARANNLLDVKSMTMMTLIEQLGLAEPERYVWTLHDRFLSNIPGAKCPDDENYIVVNRNIEVGTSALTNVQYSPYINDTFWTYRVLETCVAPNPLAVTINTSSDPYANQYTALASQAAFSGDFFTGLTRDDVGGLRYLLSSKQVATEVVDGTELMVTNLPVFLLTSNLTQLISDASTNDPAALQALYPTIQIAAYNYSYTNFVNTNYTFYYTNHPWSSTGSFPVLVALTNYTTNIGALYQYQFANVITNPGPCIYTNVIYTNGAYTFLYTTNLTFTNSNPAYTKSYLTLVYTNITAGSYVTPDQVVTNIYTTNLMVDGASGDYFIMPTNACGGLVGTAEQLRLLTITTNAAVAFPGPAILITNAINYLVTSNLARLISDATTNGPQALLALYPGLQITNYFPSFTNLITTNLTPYYTNYPWGIYGQPPVLAFTTNYSTNIGFVYQYGFGNVHTSSYSPYSLVTVLVTNVTTEPWALPGTVFTNIYQSNYWANIPSGDYYILPTNNGCGGIVILSNILSQLTMVTNGTLFVSNTLPGSLYTNLYYSETTMTYFTNQNFAYYQITCYSNPLASTLTTITYVTNRYLKYSAVACVTNPPARRRGVEKITFVRNDNYDSLLQNFTVPTNVVFTAQAVAGNTNWVQTLRRVVTQPDLLVAAEDFTPGPAAGPQGIFAMLRRNINFNQNYKQPNLAGPGTIVPPLVMTFNKVGTVFMNDYTRIGQGKATGSFLWGSFDGTTAPPVVYPNGTSLDSLENQLIMQITTAVLPTAKLRVGYTTTLAGTGGQPPYVWSLAPSSPGMPPVISVFSDGTILGIPTVAGTYDIIVRMTDSGGRYVERPLTLTVDP